MRAPFFCATVLLFFGAYVMVSAAPTDRCEDVSGGGDCDATVPDGRCYNKDRWAWCMGMPDYMCQYCATCPANARCGDYDLEDVCEDDPCGAITLPDVECIWSTEGIDHCTAGCSNVDATSSYSYDDLEECSERGCLYDFVVWRINIADRYWCLDCPQNLKCSDYGDFRLEDEGKKYQCNADPCDAPGNCTWDDDEEECVEDADGDGVLGDKDNCPRAYNPDQENTYCRKRVSDPGDVCDDTDGDGVLDSDELADPNLDPLDTDSNDNCINDGVEHTFDPVIRILNKMAIAVATVMLMYLALKWATSDDASGRSSAKAGIVYVIVGLILLIGGKDIVIFILQTKCDPAETPQLVEGVDYWSCLTLFLSPDTPPLELLKGAT